MQTLSMLIIKKLVKYVNAPSVFLNVFKLLFSTTLALIATVGILPVIRVLGCFIIFIRQGFENITNLQVIYPFLNTHVINSIILPITPYLKECLKHKDKFKILYFYYLILISISFIKPLILLLFRWSLGLILSSIGILWIESLQNISILKDLSIYIITFLDS